FRREARAAARLHHTNIVQVFGTGEQDGLHYFVMQLIPGAGLDRILLELRRLRGGTDAGSEPAADGSPAAFAQGLLTGGSFAAGSGGSDPSPLPGAPAAPAPP